MLSPSTESTSREGRRQRSRLAGMLLGILVIASPRGGESQVRVTVRDEAGIAIPFATVTLSGGSTLIADDSGRLELRRIVGDSVFLHVRRIGFREFRGWRGLRGTSHLEIDLEALARAIEPVTITARANTPLAATGFYDRVARVQRGAIVGEFLTPEALDARDAASASRALTGARFVRVERSGLDKPVLTGRGGCVMTLVVDGQRVSGMIEETAHESVPTSLDRQGTRPVTARQDERLMLDIDQVVNGLAIMAIEIYPSTANAPVELQSLGGRGSCGIVAIWTGPRR